MMILQIDSSILLLIRLVDLDIIVNNAGYTWDNVIQKMDDKQWEAILDCHLNCSI